MAEKGKDFIVFSGAIFQTIGLTYTRDIDVLILAENNKPDEVKKMNAQCSDNSIVLDPTILASDGKWYQGEKNLEYKNLWLTYLLPKSVGVDDILDIAADPKYYFIFMGIKFTSLKLNINRFLSRSNDSSLADLVMLEKINGYKIGDDLCIPNMTIRQGTIKIFDEKNIKILQTNVKKKSKNIMITTYL